MSNTIIKNRGMKHGVRRLAGTLAAAALAFGFTAGTAAFAQDDYPSKPIRMIVGFAPGGGTDIIARLVSKGLSAELKANVVVENRSGAGGIVATEMVARAQPDGYTLITAGTGTHAINPALYSDLPYDSIKDFEPVSLVSISPYLMLVSNDLPVKNVQEFIELAKSKPGEVVMASSGSGGMPHLAGELFQLLTDTKLLHVPYKGTGEVFTDLAAGRTQMAFSDIAAAYPHIQSGKVRALAITSPERSTIYPDVPTLVEEGVEGYEAIGWFGVFAPAGTPKPIIENLSNAIKQFIDRPEVLEQLRILGAEPKASTPDEFLVQLKADLERWGDIVKRSGAAIR